MKSFVRISIITFATLMLFVNISSASTGKVNTKTVRVREKASTSSEVITNVYRNDEVEIVSEEGEWYKVNVSGKTGFIKAEYLTVNSSSVSDTTQSSQSNTNTSAGIATQVKVKLRAMPSIISSSVGNLEANVEISKLDEINNWVKISDGKISGWVLNNKIGEKKVEQEKQEPAVEQNNQTNTESKAEEKKEENATSEINKKAIVNVKTLRVRKNPSTTGDNIIDLLDYNDEVTVISKEGTWYKISYDGKEGYVSAELLVMKDEQRVSSRSLVEDRNSVKEETEKQPEEQQEQQVETQINPPASASGQAVVDFAMQFMGYPYVAAGKKPETGFDCSGFTSYVFSNFGVSLGGSAASQVGAGTEVPREALSAGDLLLFYDDGYSKVGHAGIYISDGNFIHAANPKRGVVIDNLNTSSYYNPRFVTARRVVQ